LAESREQLTGEVTRLLHELGHGRREVEADLIPLVYKELRRISSRLMRGEGHHTLQTTALVHEAYLRLARPRPNTWKDRTHFFAVAATVMRRILVDHARARTAKKRGRLTPMADPFEPIQIDEPERVLAIDMALSRLSELDARQARIVELRFFAGMSVEETAEALQVSATTIKREWKLARAWLLGELAPLT
jgi:RNA polymerase sigma factor (TIGR02999 family)